MNKKLLLILFIISVNFLFASTIDKPVSSQYGFIENKGQIIDQNNNLNPSVLYLYNGNGLHVQLKKSGFSYEVWKAKPLSKFPQIGDNLNSQAENVGMNIGKSIFRGDIEMQDSIYIHRIDISFVNSNQNVKIISSEPASDYINFYTTGTSEQGAINVCHYKKVLYENIYPNIDVEFVLNDSKQKGAFKYNFIIHPGGNVNDIQLKFDGANSTSLTNDGHITIETAYGNIDESIPMSYQLNDQNKQESIHATFTSNLQFLTSNLYGISIGQYDPTKTLIIDPAPWATYFGGSGGDYGQGITIDINGNVCITGYTNSNYSFASIGAYQSSLGTSVTEDAFIAKFNSSGIRLWSTYYGGINDDYGNGIATDANGNISIVGTTSSGIVMASTGAYQTSYRGYIDAFLATFDSTGSRLWSTYYGSYSAYGRSIAICDTNIYITGYSATDSTIITSGAYQTSFGGGNSDAYIAMFGISGSRIWGTYYGGSGDELGMGISTDQNCNLYVTGITNSTSGIATSGAYQTSYGGGSNDAFIVKFNSTGSQQWSTYYGGSGDDNGLSISNYVNGNIAITGYTTSTTGIATSGSYQTSVTYGGNGTYDIFLTKFDSSGSRLWGTYYGGSNTDIGYGVTIDSSENIYIVGYSLSQIIAPNGYYTFQFLNAGNEDAFLAKFNSSGSLKWGTFYGGTWDDAGKAIALNTLGEVFITGYTYSSGIATSGAYQTSITSSNDIFIANFTSAGGLVKVANNSITGNQSICVGKTPGSIYGSSPTGGNGSFTYRWQKSTVSSTSDFINAGKNDSTKNYSSAPMSINTWLRRIATSLGVNDTSNTIAVTMKLKSGFSINNTDQCVNGNNFIFNDTTSFTGGTLSLQWNFGTSVNDTSSLANPTKNYSAFGTYSVKLVSIGSNGCTDSITKQIHVYDTPIIGLTVNDIGQCKDGNSFFFNDTSHVNFGSMTRLWNFGDNTTSVNISPTKSYSSSANYGVKLIVNNNGCKDSLLKTVAVYPMPKTGFSINNREQCVNDNNFIFTDTTFLASGSFNRLWYLGEDDTTSSVSPIKHFTSTTIFFISLVSISDHGCKDSLSKIVKVDPKPNVGFTINNTLQCINGNSFIFSDTSFISVDTLASNWKFSNGDESKLSTISKIFNAANEYSVKLVSTSNWGCKDSIVKTVVVKPSPAIGFTINNSSQCLNGNDFLFTDTSHIDSGTIIRQWDLGTGNMDTSSIYNPSKIYTSANSYSVKLIETGSNGCIDSLIRTITIYPKPNVGFTINNSSQCLNGNSFVLNDTSTISSGTLNRNWDFGNGSNSSLSNPTISYTDANTYQVKIVSISNNGCSDSVIKTVTIFPKPNVGFTQNLVAQCLSGNNFILNDTTNITSGTLNRIWSFGDTTTSTSASTNKSYSSAGNYTIKLVEISNNNCADSISKTATIYNQPKSGFTISDTSQCLIGNSFSLNDTTSSTSNRLWDLGDLTTNTNDTFSKTFSNAGTYQVKLKVVDTHNCSDSSTKTIIVKASPAKPNITALSKSLLQSSVANSYQWYLNNSIISSATNQTLAITTNGNYSVKIDTTDGCANISNPFAANSVGVNEIYANNEIKIYPNPATDELNISFSSLQNGKDILIEIIDLKGSKLMSVNQTLSATKTININLIDLATGMYFVMINNQAYKFVKADK